MKSDQNQTPNKRSPRFLLLIAEDIREPIHRSAAVHNRTVTAEINLRLRESLKQEEIAKVRGTANVYPLGRPASVAVARESLPGDLTDLDLAILEVIRTMPPEKRLAFLTLFK